MDINRKIQKTDIGEELKTSYLDYAMSVIVGRALPDVRDGLKPVQRRILWAMWESGITSGSKFRKCANIVGEVMGKYHPHGDAAIYDTLVRMAQDFSLRYRLIEGQGNFGSIDGDPAAAFRYTESRLSKIAEEMLLDIEKEVVGWQPNYDGSKSEPDVLPAKIPNLLINGTMGIAVGMATNIPPHNLSEVIDATLYLIGNPGAKTEDLIGLIKGPDFPTGGIIYGAKNIVDTYKQGRGSVTIRAVADVQTKKVGDREQAYIEITEIPYQVNKAELLIKIAELVQDKKIEDIKDIRDESDKDGLRIIIELKSNATPQKILNRLYSYTDLQKDFHYNMVALEQGIQPQIFSLKEILAAHIEHRKIIVRKRAEFDLRKAEERAHILLGLVKALSNIDKAISLIKKSKDKEDARQKLMKAFKLTEVQANAILEMKLQSLASLERQRIEDELKEKKRLITDLQSLLKGQARILNVIKDELEEIKKKYGDERRTKIVAAGLKEFKEEDLIQKEDVVITFSKSGFIKRVLPSSFRVQQRGGKGTIASEVEEADFLQFVIKANTHDSILFFTDKGRVFCAKVYELPQATRMAKGKPVYNFLNMPMDEKISAIITYSDDDKKLLENGHLVMVTKNGIVKKTALKAFQNIRKNGIIAINLKKDDLLRAVKLSSGKDEIMIVSQMGQAIRFKEEQARSMGRAGAGVVGIRLKKDDLVSAFDIIPAGHDKESKVLVVMENGFGKRTSLGQYRLQRRGGSGIKTAKVTNKTGKVVVSKLLGQETELLALSAKGQIIRTFISDIRLASRATQGVKIMNLNLGDKVVSVAII